MTRRPPDRAAPAAEDAPLFASNALAGRRALVTGGTRGIGRAIVLGLAGAGAGVTATYVQDTKAAEALTSALATHGTAHAVVRCDVRDGTAIAALFESLKPAGGVDILINNAAIARDAHLMMLSDDAWQEVLTTNLTGPFLCTRPALRGMIARRFGRIINVISPAGVVGKAGAANYAASKGGLLSMTKALAREVAGFGITVNALCPGVVETELVAALPSQVREAMIAQIPAGRAGQPTEIAHAAVFLASPAASYITGAVLMVDGGLVMA